MPHTPGIFVNLPVTSLQTAVPFYETLGFKKNPMFSSDDTTCMVLTEHISIMLMEHTRFQSFMPAAKSLVSGRSGTETLLCVTVGEREDVDKLVTAGAEKGGKADPTMLPEMPGGYGRSMEDPDGHVWEIAYMGGMAACEEGE